ncbi:NUMOD4 motif protein [compost metagenome]
MEEVEIWKDVEGYEGMYQVSNLGRVKSLPRFKKKTEQIISGSLITTGYLVVQLRKNNKRSSKLIHRLVLAAFDPHPEQDELLGNHKDLDRLNNKLSNLEWTTAQGNCDHYWDTTDLSQRKETPKGESHHLAKLTEDDVREIRRLYFTEEIENYSEIARRVGIGPATVSAIIKGKIWWRVK